MHQIAADGHSSPEDTSVVESHRFLPWAANLIVLAVPLYAWTLSLISTDLFYSSVQEDEYLEWITFWAFVGAAMVFAFSAYRSHSSSGSLPWFQCGISLLCLLIAMEEISWGQRIFGYRPPVYFLENNFQQELNIHNVFSTHLRKLTLKSTILGFGVLLPALNLLPLVRRLLTRLGVSPPPASLIPAFLATWLLYETYPFRFAGEIVELMLGTSFLLAGFTSLGISNGVPLRQRLLPVGIACLAIATLGTLNAAWSRKQRAGSPEVLEAAKRESEALKGDFQEASRLRKGRLPTRCGIHRRLYTFTQRSDAAFLEIGKFAALTSQGLPEERAAYFLDPWNSPYWIRHICRSGKTVQRVMIYSFGPNRRRDSTRWEIKGDDVGAVIYDRGAEE